MPKVCGDFKTAVEEQIEQPVETLVEKLQEVCEEQKCNWWSLCLNVLLCWLAWVVVRVVIFVVITVTKWVSYTVCQIVGFVLGPVVKVVAGITGGCRILCQFYWSRPTYKPSRWNDNNGIQFNNNCYNYACDIKTGTYAQPGRASGNMYASFDCTEVTKGAVSDGLTRLASCTEGCARCCHKVALAIAPGWDYHWYRQDENLRWSHKPGQTAATDLDNSGNPITDPATADRGPYTVFCGCFCVCVCQVQIN